MLHLRVFKGRDDMVEVIFHANEIGRSKLRTAADVRNDDAADADKYSEK